MSGPFALVTSLRVGNFENQPIHARNILPSLVHQKSVRQNLFEILSTVEGVPIEISGLYFLRSNQIRYTVGMSLTC